MKITRRSLLGNLAVLSAASSLPGVLSAAEGRGQSPSLPSGPNPDSIFVLFEGPWVVYESKPGFLTALTFNQIAGSSAGMHHQCAVGLGKPGDSDIHTMPNTLQPLVLPGSAKWNITMEACKPSPWKKAMDLFDEAFKKDAFVYVRDKGVKVSPLASDRTVTLPLPNQIYLGGSLKTAQVEDKKHFLYASPTSSQILPYVTVILEYTPLQATGISQMGLALETGSTHQAKLSKGDHLVFRMEYRQNGQMSALEEAKHIKSAFGTLASRIHTTVGTVPISLSKLSDASYNTGSNTGHFDDAEMGLKQPSHPRIDNYGNCGGAGYLVA